MAGLRIIAGNRLEDLAGSFAGMVGEDPLPPLCPETVVVQSPAMERWFSISMASCLGVWADYTFPYPNQIVHSILRAFFPDITGERVFDRDLMAWRLVDIIPSRMEDDRFDVIRRYIDANAGGAALYHLARQIADLFDQYLTFRPEMINRWDAGQEEGEESWQAILWRDLAPSLPGTHPPRLRNEFLEKVKSCGQGAIPGLPPRITVFGVSYLPPFHAEILLEVSRVIPVYFFMLAPTHHYWGDIPTRREAGYILRSAGSTPDPDTLHLEGDTSLLASLGRPGRDFQKLLVERDYEIDPCFTEPGGGTLLAQLQRSIFNMDAGQKIKTGADDSLRMVSCHGPLREVEVLHDYILDLFENDKTLEPRDILVMTPDIETYAPYISAVFSRESGIAIPCDVVDRLASRESSLLRALFILLDLPDHRMTGPEIMDLLSNEAVSGALGLDRSDLDLARNWISESGIRWGLDGAFREEMGLPGIHENTWRHGLDRLVAGYVLDDDSMYNGIVPMTGIGTGSARVLGVLHMFIETVAGFIGGCRTPRTPAEWAGFLEDTFNAFSPAADDGDYRIIRDALLILRRTEEGGASNRPVSFETVRAFLRGLSSTARSKRPLLSGRVTFSQMIPLRSIPFRVICLLGMNDGMFPRSARSAGFDLMGNRPMPGDRSLRDEDRYMFLEILLSVRDKLYISYTGQSIEDNSRIPPSVLVSELLDYIVDCCGEAGPPLREELVVRHPLQTFSRRYFQPDGLWTYSSANYRALLSASGKRRNSQPFISRPLEPACDEVITMNDLISFINHPARYFLIRRLGLRFPGAGLSLEDVEPFSIEGLDRYNRGEDLTGILLNDPEGDIGYLNRLRAMGELPHGGIGRCEFDILARDARSFADIVRPHVQTGIPEPVEGEIRLADSVLRVRLAGYGPDGFLAWRYAGIKAKDLYGAWIRHLCLCVLSPAGVRKRTTVIGRDGTMVINDVVDPLEHLQVLVRLYLEGQRGLCHFLPQTSWAYCRALDNGSEETRALNEALKTWNGDEGSGVSGEADDSYNALFYRASPLPLDAKNDSLPDRNFRKASHDVCDPILTAMKEEI